MDNRKISSFWVVPIYQSVTNTNIEQVPHDATFIFHVLWKQLGVLGHILKFLAREYSFIFDSFVFQGFVSNSIAGLFDLNTSLMGEKYLNFKALDANFVTSYLCLL